MIDYDKFAFSSKAPTFTRDENARKLLADKSFTEPLEKSEHLIWEDGVAYFDAEAVKAIKEKCDEIQREKAAL